MTSMSCLIGLRYIEPLSSVSLLFFLLLFPCDTRYPSQLLKEVSFIRRHWSVCDPVVFAHLQHGIDLQRTPFSVGFAHLQRGIDPRNSRTDCDVIDINSAPDESAKASSYFHVHGSHLKVSLAWSFPSCFDRLCLHVAVALVWLLHYSIEIWFLNDFVKENESEKNQIRNTKRVSLNRNANKTAVLLRRSN